MFSNVLIYLTRLLGLYQCDCIRLSVRQYIVSFSHFQLLQNHCMPSHQAYYKCSSRGSEEVLLLFGVISNLRWPPWHLIGRDIYLSRKTAC